MTELSQELLSPPCYNFYWSSVIKSETFEILYTTFTIASRAIRRGDIDYLELILSGNLQLLSVKYFGEGLLYTAVRCEKTEIAHFLLDNGVRPSADNEFLLIDFVAGSPVIHRRSCREAAAEAGLTSVVTRLDDLTARRFPFVVAPTDEATRKKRIIKGQLDDYDLSLLFSLNPEDDERRKLLFGEKIDVEEETTSSSDFSSDQKHVNFALHTERSRVPERRPTLTAGMSSLKKSARKKQTQDLTAVMPAPPPIFRIKSGTRPTAASLLRRDEKIQLSNTVVKLGGATFTTRLPSSRSSREVSSLSLFCDAPAALSDAPAALSIFSQQSLTSLNSLPKLRPATQPVPGRRKCPQQFTASLNCFYRGNVRSAKSSCRSLRS